MCQEPFCNLGLVFKGFWLLKVHASVRELRATSLQGRPPRGSSLFFLHGLRTS
jgi:hypothetical protein